MGEALRSGYTDELQEAGRSSATQLAAKKATQALKTLKEAVDSAEFVVQHGIFEDADVSSLAEVEKASAAASSALSALEQARAHDPEQESRCHEAFGAKLNTLATTHQGVPEVMKQLERLRRYV